MNRILLFFNKIMGLVLFTILVLLVISHFRHRHHGWHKHGQSIYKNGQMAPSKDSAAPMNK